MIQYTKNKDFTKEQIQSLFTAVTWESGQYPNRLYKALQYSSCVITAWDGQQLVGLIRALDDGEMTAFVHYLLIHPNYQGLGIGNHLVEMIKETYQDYFYIKLMVPLQKNVDFYKKCGFSLLPDGSYMQIHNIDWQDD